MNESHWKWWRELLHGEDHVQAHRVEREALAEAERKMLSPEFVREQARLRGNGVALRLGRLSEGPRRDEDLLVDAHDLLAHQHVMGASGSGKTYYVVHQLLALLRRKTVNSLVVLDMKGELAELLTDQALPGLAAGLPSAEADAFLKRIVVIDPFSATHLPPLNVLVRDPGLPVAIQARDVAECFEAATECDVTTRMETILDWFLRLAIETRTSFLGVRRALQEPAVLEGLVREAKDPDTIRYFVLRFPSEPKASKLALLARLDRFLALPMTELCLGAKVCLDFDALLADRITIVSLGKVPAGLQSVARFFAMVILTRFIRAIFRLPPQSRGFASVLVADEWQVALNPALASEFESILTLARSRGVYLWLANQQLAQLDRHGASLRSTVLGQVTVQTVFRLADEDARLLKRLFPVTGTLRRAGVPGRGAGPVFLAPSEEIEARLNAASKLPDRLGYVLDRRKPWGAVPFRSATLDLPASSTLPAHYVKRAQRGTVAFTVAELEQMHVAEDARLDALAAGPGRPAALPIASPATAPAPSPPRRGPPRASSPGAAPVPTPTPPSTSTSPTSPTPTPPSAPSRPAPKRGGGRRGGRGGRGGPPPIR